MTSKILSAQLCVRRLLDEMIEEAVPHYPTRLVAVYVLDAETLRSKLAMKRLTMNSIRAAIKYLTFNRCVAEFNAQSMSMRVEVNLCDVALTLDQARKLTAAQRSHMVNA